MTLLRFLPFLMLAVPLAEIGMFILVGQAIGILPTIALVLLTAVTGATLLRIHGIGQIARIRAALDTGAMPGREIAHGAMMLVAGVLLLTPGFITDTLGFLLFVPALRERLYRFLAARVRIVTPAGMSGGMAGGMRDDWSAGPEFGAEGDRRPAGGAERTIDLAEGDYADLGAAPRRRDGPGSGAR